VLSVLFRTPVLVLETVGRRSGATRRTTLAYHRADDGTLLVVGGAGGQSVVPDWVLNLRASPRAVVTVDRTRIDVHAVELVGPARDVAWSALRAVWPQIERYERRAGRAVPTFQLHPD
jgi:deazaflavin-dependent oxidoreductase (nitroreductase family)